MFHPFVRGVLCVAGLVSVSSNLRAQPRGVELMNAMLSRPLARTTGVTSVRWLPDRMGYLERDSSAAGAIFSRVDPASGRRTPFFDQRTVASLRAEFRRLTGAEPGGLPFDAFTLEQGGRSIAFAAGGARYLFDLGRRELRRLRMPERVGPLDEATTEPGRFSPDFNWYVFIRDYDNLHLFDTRTGDERPLARGTSANNLVGFLGAGPWFVWSPDSRRIAYLTADQQAISTYPIVDWLTHPASVDQMRYPFTTDPDPRLALQIVDLATGAVVPVARGTVEEPYLRNIEWFEDGSELTFQVVSRWENRITLKAAEPASGQVRTILVDEIDTYHDPLRNFRQLDGGARFTWSSERSGWRHLYLYDRQGGLLRQLTQGEWDTGEIAAIDTRGGWVYFAGATRLGLERHFFRVRLDGTSLTRLTEAPGVHRATMDPAGTWFLDSFSSLAAPRTVTLHAADGRLLRTLATTDTAQVGAMGLLPPELLTLKAADGVTDIHGLLFKPADFDSTRRYPMIVQVYGGPHTKAVRNSYETTGARAALAQLGFLVAEFDGRGTLDRGKAFQAGNYLRLGQEDVDDQAAAVRQLYRRPFVDSARVGVTGLSHGGYLTLMMMLRYPDVYQVGVAGAPLTDPRLGPRQYIGRIMRTPAANPEGYAAGNALTLADRLRGRLLIYHGTADRNVMIGATLQLVRKFVDAGRPVDLMIYPGGVHVLEGVDAGHNFRNVASYLLEHLRPDGWERSRAALWAPR